MSEDKLKRYRKPIDQHGGAKYLRRIYSAADGTSVLIDVYDVIDAFGVTCPAQQHALKKLLACGNRGKGSRLDDLCGVLDATWRAVELEERRQRREAEDVPTVLATIKVPHTSPPRPLMAELGLLWGEGRNSGIAKCGYCNKLDPLPGQTVYDGAVICQCKTKAMAGES
jgi:hypothetical protein